MIKKLLIVLIILIAGFLVYLFYLKGKPANEVYRQIENKATNVQKDIKSAVKTEGARKVDSNPMDWQKLLPQNEKEIYKASQVPKDKSTGK